MALLKEMLKSFLKNNNKQKWDSDISESHFQFKLIDYDKINSLRGFYYDHSGKFKTEF